MSTSATARFAPAFRRHLLTASASSSASASTSAAISSRASRPFSLFPSRSFSISSSCSSSLSSSSSASSLSSFAFSSPRRCFHSSPCACASFSSASSSSSPSSSSSSPSPLSSSSSSSSISLSAASFDPSHQEAVNNLLYNIPAKSSYSSRRTLCALVSNEPGVLSRISGCLAGRGFNIDSLVVSETETEGLSRMTIVLKGGTDVDQARKQLEDLVQVWAVVEFSPFAPVVERELLLIKLSIVPPTSSATIPPPSSSTYPLTSSTALTAHVQRQAIVELCNLFGGRVLDLTPAHIMIELTGKSMRLDAFIQLVRPFGIVELARSGALAMLRGSVTSVNSKQEKKIETGPKVDETNLPPG